MQVLNPTEVNRVTIECSSEQGALYSNWMTWKFWTRIGNMDSPSKVKSICDQLYRANTVMVLWVVWEKTQLCRKVKMNKENPRIRKKRMYDNVRKFFLAANTWVLEDHLPDNTDFCLHLSILFFQSVLASLTMWRSLDGLYLWANICSNWHWKLSKTLSIYSKWQTACIVKMSHYRYTE